MAASFTRQTEKKVLDLLLGGVALTPPATWYLALLTDSNTKVQRDTQTFTEVPGTNGYARKAITNNTTNFPASVEGTVTINGVSTICAVKVDGVDFTWVTPTGSWGTPKYVGFFDASTAGVMWLWFDLDNPLAVDSGNIMSLPANTGMQFGLD